MKKGALEMEKLIAIIIIVVLLIALVVFAKLRFDEVKEFILGFKFN